MIAGTLTERTTWQYTFDFPLNARDLADAMDLVEDAIGTTVRYDGRYYVSSDGISLVFQWED